MIFNINAALLDALVLAIVCQEKLRVLMVIRLHRMYVKQLMYRNLLYILFSADCKRTIVSKFMTKSIPDETGVITR